MDTWLVFQTPQERKIVKFNNIKQQLLKKYKVKKLSTMQVRYLEKGIESIGYWDIETSDFKPYQNFMICYCFERRDILTGKIEKFEYHITKSDIASAVSDNNFNFDYKLLQNLSRCLNSVDQIIGHYASKFDKLYYNARCTLTKQSNLVHDFGIKTQGDTWRMMKNTLKADRNTLHNFILTTTGKSDKTHVDLEYWYKARFKDSPDWQKSIDYILDHCRKDVEMTRKGHMIIEPFTSISGILI
jgi:hypothetical protein